MTKPPGEPYKVVPGTNISLDAEDFRKLVSGETLTIGIFDGSKIIYLALSDIGWSVMVDIIIEESHP